MDEPPPASEPPPGAPPPLPARRRKGPRLLDGWREHRRQARERGRRERRRWYQFRLSTLIIVVIYANLGFGVRTAWQEYARSRAGRLLDNVGSCVYAVAVAPDGERVWAGGDAGLKAWPSPTAPLPPPLPPLIFGAVSVLTVAPDGKLLASGSSGGGILCLADDGAFQSFWPTSRGRICALAFSPDGRRLLSASVGYADQARVCVDDLESDDRLFEWPLGHGAKQDTDPNVPAAERSFRVTAAAFTPDGRYVLAGGLRGAGPEEVVRLFDLADGRLRAEWASGRSAKAIVALTVSPDGRYVLAGKYLLEFLPPEEAAGGPRLVGRRALGDLDATAVAFSPDSHRALTAVVLRRGDIETGVELRLWSIPGRRLLQRLRGHTGPVAALAFTPDGTAAVSGGLDGRVFLWRPNPRAVWLFYGALALAALFTAAVVVYRVRLRRIELAEHLAERQAPRPGFPLTSPRAEV